LTSCMIVVNKAGLWLLLNPVFRAPRVASPERFATPWPLCILFVFSLYIIYSQLLGHQDDCFGMYVRTYVCRYESVYVCSMYVYM
jgi:hypothetical protein